MQGMQGARTIADKEERHSESLPSLPELEDISCHECEMRYICGSPLSLWMTPHSLKGKESSHAEVQLNLHTHATL